MKYAIIGGLGSGKSSITKFLASIGKKTFDCDEIAKQLMEEECYTTLVKESFPNAVRDGEVDRRRLGKIVFEDDEKLALLNSLIHPLVKNKLEKIIRACGKTDVFVEVSVFEGSGLEDFFDRIICVVADDEVRIARAIQRKGYDRQHCKLIMRNQPSQQKLMEIADFVVHNDNDFKFLQNQIIEILEKMV